MILSITLIDNMVLSISLSGNMMLNILSSGNIVLRILFTKEYDAQHTFTRECAEYLYQGMWYSAYFTWHISTREHGTRPHSSQGHLHPEGKSKCLAQMTRACLSLPQAPKPMHVTHGDVAAEDLAAEEAVLSQQIRRGRKYVYRVV